MNKLQRFIAANDLDEIKVMNVLQLNGIISDCAVMAEDVSDADFDRAWKFVATCEMKELTANAGSPASTPPSR